MSLSITLIEGCCKYCGQGEEILDLNITHNLSTMAKEVGLYHLLWRDPEFSRQVLIEEVKFGLAKLKADPDYFKSFNPENGWGKYEVLVNFTANFLSGLIKYPNALINRSV